MAYRFVLLAAAGLALVACGSQDDASHWLPAPNSQLMHAAGDARPATPLPLDVTLGEAKDNDWEANRPGAVDDEARGHGDAVLVLRVVDEDTGEPITTSVKLWRLGVPASGTWTAGDHVQRNFSVFDAAARIEGLPVGRYRLQLEGQRPGSPDPPEFPLASGETRLQFSARMPRSFRAHLVVVDETGTPLTSGKLGTGLMDSSVRIDHAPAWARPRHLVDGSTPRPDRMNSDSWGARELKDATAGAGVFDVGEFREGTRYTRSNHDLEFSTEGRTGVGGRISSDLGEDTTFYAVSVAQERVLQNVTMPDGARLDPTSATRIWTYCVTKMAREPPPDDWWRDFPIHVSVTVPGHDELEFDWTTRNTSQRRQLRAE